MDKNEWKTRVKTRVKTVTNAGGEERNIFVRKF